MRVFAIGINEYSRTNNKVNLKGAVPDAKSIAEAFQTHSYPTPPPPQILTDASASREGIAAAFRQTISASKPNETFVFYFAGQAVAQTKSSGEREWYLLPSDFLAGETGAPGSTTFDEATLESRGISARLLKSWVSQVQARSQLVIIDSNHAEAAVPAFTSHILSQGSESLDLARAHVEVFGPQGAAMETPDGNGTYHGAFTRALIQGLNGAADVFPKDGKITAEELRIFASGQLLAESVQTSRAELVTSENIGGDFTIAQGSAEASRGAEPAPSPAPTQPPARSEGKNYALLIATDRYQSSGWKQLSNPVYDATTLETDLRSEYGFKTKLLTNPTRQELYKVLAEYHNMNFSPDDQLLIFIAGHGKYDEVSGEGYLVMADSKDDDPESSSYYPLSLIRGTLENMPAGHILFLLDSCFSGAFADKLGAAGGRFGDEYTKLKPAEIRERILKHKSRLYLTSGGKEYVPDGRPGQHSPFAREVLDTLERQGDLGGFVTFDNLKTNLVRVTPEPHAGEFGSSETGANFIFIATK